MLLGAMMTRDLTFQEVNFMSYVQEMNHLMVKTFAHHLQMLLVTISLGKMARTC